MATDKEERTALILGVAPDIHFAMLHIAQETFLKIMI